MKTLLITRDRKTSIFTTSVLSIDGEVVCLAMELPWKDNRRNVSCIPPGKYQGIRAPDRSGCPAFWIENVPGRDGIMIHVGNYLSETEGCVLTGMKFYDTPEPKITSSKFAARLLGSVLPDVFDVEVV